MIFTATRLFTGTEFTGPATIVVERGRIADMLPYAVAGADVALDSGFLAPGLIDLHNNGAFGVDCATATPAEWSAYIAGLRAHGVTAVLPTIITAPFAALRRSAARVRRAMCVHPAILGLHLEGPFLSPAQRGAHRADWLREPTPEALQDLLADPSLRQILRLVTLAPELPGALAAIRHFAAAGIRTALGHTNATVAEMAAAADAGASLVTHVFNAMSALHHRGPNAPGAALTHPRLHPCLIADGLHVDPMVLAIAIAACPRAIAVTDSILIAGQPEGAQAEFGGGPVQLQGGIGRRPDGGIAGAAITLDEGIRRLIGAGIAPEVALATATSRPANAMGLADRGRIAPGARADLVWWSSAYAVQQVWTAGLVAPPETVPRGTEHPRPDLADLDQRSTIAIVETFLAQEHAAHAALAREAGKLAVLADAVAKRLAAGGRLFYAGAGTSGRLALLDAVECGPTFGLAPGVIIPILAGGEAAFLQAVEGAEDDAAAATAALKHHNITAADVLVGIAASGATPFTLAAIRTARQAGAYTGAIVNNARSRIAATADLALEIDTGSEVIAGSTRLSAGTTQKIALNILSSTVMIRLGKTHGPYMVDLRATNTKLRRRAARITAEIAEVDEAQAEAALAMANMHVKISVLVLRLNITAAEAEAKLSAANGSLRKALEVTG